MTVIHGVGSTTPGGGGGGGGSGRLGVASNASRDSRTAGGLNRAMARASNASLTKYEVTAKTKSGSTDRCDLVMLR